MSIKKFSMLLLSAMSLAALLNGCGSSNKEGSNPGGVARVADEATCRVCHASTIDPVSQRPIITDYLTSSHFENESIAGCQGCHGGGAQHNGVGPIPFPNPLTANRCITCHTANGVVPTNKDLTQLFEQAKTDFVGICAPCHTATGNGGVHAARVTSQNCITCHDVGRKGPEHGAAQVNDNNGVRAITAEFTKWSHHVTGVTLDSAHCAACHLEGTVEDGKIVVDKNKHMTDNKTHLRNSDTDADFAWDPAAPDHTGMDNFCMSCHDANGATSPMSVNIQKFINDNGLAATGKTASASNPFGDTISNQYDKMQRPAVVDASGQFNTSNSSHHAVKGKRYTGRSRVSNGGTIADAAFTANSSANLPGKRTTIYDAGKFNSLYVTLKNDGGETGTPGTLTGRNGGTKLGDDSTLHCGDCHTVGQWKVGSSVNAAGAPTPAAIGAHGSNNEYLLRNSIGTDARHQGVQLDSTGVYHPDTVTPYLVCYNCHDLLTYTQKDHAGEQDAEANCDTSVNTNSINLIGANRLKSINTMTSGANIFGAQTATDTNGNIFGIQCNNCHNSGISAGNIFGGIHGSADPTYKDGAGNTTKHERFLPGLGNVMYAPGTRGGITGGTTAFQSYSSKVQTSGISKGLRFKGTYAYTTGGVTNDANWEEKNRIPVGDGVTGWSHNPGAAGCYTISEEAIVPYNAEGNGVPAGPPASLGLKAPNGDLLAGNWGGCVDHGQQQGASVRQPRNTNTSIRPVTY